VMLNKEGAQSIEPGFLELGQRRPAFQEIAGDF